MNSQIYVHYGAKQFNPALNFPIKNKYCWTKPKGGLWASRKNASFGWKDLCAKEGFVDCDDDNSFEFIMKDESRIAVISTLHQLQRLPHPRYENNWMPDVHLIDFEQCVQLDIDAVELCWYGYEFKKIASDNLHFELCEWNCDSIVVLNPDAIIQKYN